MEEALNLEEKFTETFAEFERSEASFLSRIKRKLESLPEKDRGIDDLLQTVKLECWKSNLLQKEHPVRYIKTCLKNFVNKQIKSRLVAFGGLHYLVSTDEEGFAESRSNAVLSTESAAQSAIEAAETLKIILKCLDPTELAHFKIVFWDDAGNEALYEHFRQIRHPRGLDNEMQVRAFKEGVRQEKCRMIKKVQKIRALIDEGKYDDGYIKKLSRRRD